MSVKEGIAGVAVASPEAVPPSSPPVPERPAAGTAASPRQEVAARLFAEALAHHRAGRLVQAVNAYGSVLALVPQDTRAANNMGVALRALGRREAAEACYRRVLKLDPRNASAYVNLGNVLRDLGRLVEAQLAHRRALALNPDERGAWYGLGLIARDCKRLDEAVRCLEKALALSPDDPDLNWDLALTLLCKGDFRRGFAQYEWRWRLPGVARPQYDAAAWDGKPLAGRRLLLYGEQGFGDVIQFARFVPLAARGGRVVLHVRPELVSVLRGQFAGVERVVARSESPPPCDVAAPLLSVPYLLGVQREDVPRGPYLKPVRRPVPVPSPAPGTRLKVALCWQGSPTHRNDRNRSMPFDALLPLLRHADVAFYSVQKGEAARDPDRHGVGPLIRTLDPALRDFADTAAVLAGMDLVITVDTAVLHLAAAMGRPVWVLLPVQHDWRFDDRDSIDTWYTTVRVFKQTTVGDWSDVVRRVDAALADILQDPP